MKHDRNWWRKAIPTALLLIIWPSTWSSPPSWGADNPPASAPAGRPLPLGDAPPADKPVVPVATIVVPSVQPLIVFADGSVSKSALTWQVVEPGDAKVRIEGAAAIIENPVPGTTYKLALVAVGDAPPFAFKFASVTAPGTVPPKVDPPPNVGPVGPVGPPPPGPGPSTDRFGLVAWARDYLASVTWTDDTLGYRRGTVGPAFEAASIAAAGGKDLQDAITKGGDAVKQKIAPELWPTWKPSVVGPIQQQLQALVTGGKVKTPADVAAALADAAVALKEGGRR